MAPRTEPHSRIPWPIAAPALAVALALAGFVLAPPMARRSLVEPAWTIERLLQVPAADGETYVLSVERDGPAGAATATDRLSRLTLRRAADGQTVGRRVVAGAARPELPGAGEGEGVRHVWVRFEGDEAPIALAVPDLEPASDAGAPPKGPLPTPAAEVCRTRRVMLPDGARLTLTEGDRSQVDPGLLPGDAPPREPERDAHGHAVEPPASTARGPMYVEAGFLCEPGSTQRTPMLAGEGDVLVVHRPDDPRERLPMLSRVTRTARRVWALEGTSLLPPEVADGEHAFRWIRRAGPDLLLVAIEGWAPGQRGWWLAGVDLARGERAWTTALAQ